MYVSVLEIERSQNELNLIVKTSRPGLLIGRGGEGVEKLKREIQALALKKKIALPKNFKVSVEEKNCRTCRGYLWQKRTEEPPSTTIFPNPKATCAIPSEAS